MIRLGRILVATDFGPASERALSAAADLVARLGAELAVVHVLEPSGVALADEDAEELRALADAYLEATAATLRDRAPEVKVLLREGQAWEEIVRAAKEIDADLVVLGTHGRRGLPHLLMGSVSERVVRASPVPVLTLHGFYFQDRATAGRELGIALRGWRRPAPGIVAISRGGVVVGAEVARELHGTLDLLLTRPLDHRGAILGAIAENGATYLDPGMIGAAVGLEEHDHLISTSRRALDAEALRLRGAPWTSDAWRARSTMILVTDVLTDPWRALVAVDVARQLEPERIVVAAVVASDATVARLRQEIADTVVLHTLRADSTPRAVFRAAHEPRTRALVELLRGAHASAA